MTLPTPEALREAVERVRGPSRLQEMEEALGTRCAVLKADVRSLLEAADLLLSEEWQGMAEAGKVFAETDSRKAQLDLCNAALSLARKLAAQEEEK